MFSSKYVVWSSVKEAMVYRFILSNFCELNNIGHLFIMRIIFSCWVRIISFTYELESFVKFHTSFSQIESCSRLNKGLSSHFKFFGLGA